MSVSQIRPQNATRISEDPAHLINSLDDYDKSELIKLRKSYANKLFFLLVAETVALFAIILLNGFRITSISDVNMNIFTGATLTHTFFLVRIVVLKLFA